MSIFPFGSDSSETDSIIQELGDIIGAKNALFGAEDTPVDEVADDEVADDVVIAESDSTSSGTSSAASSASSSSSAVSPVVISSLSASGASSAGAANGVHADCDAVDPCDPFADDSAVASADFFGTDEAEFISGEAGDSILFGNGGNDTLLGDIEGSGLDKLFAGKGDDDVLGNDGDDILFGEEGDDRIFGGDGNDYIRGGAGTDSLFGGSGTDIFALFPGAGTDVIFDFEEGIDIIGLGCGITFDQLTLEQSGRGTIISLDGETLAFVNKTTATNFTEDTFLSV